MQSQYIEATVGTAVLALAAFILWFGYTHSGSNDAESYTVSALFNRIDGISKGNDVKMSGIKIGTVKSQGLDQSTYMAKIELQLNQSVKIPSDSSVAVISDGLLGGKYLDISPGGSDAFLENGGEIKHTQSSINLESLIGNFVFSQGNKKE